MFLVSHSLELRAKEIRSWLPKHASVALIVAAVYFEWALSRALIGLSRRPNQDVRDDLQKTYGLARYENRWRKELTHLLNAQPLSDVVRDWDAVLCAFKARNVLVHGRDRFTPKMAQPHVESLLDAVSDVCVYCLRNGVDINRRLPQRRRKRFPDIINHVRRAKPGEAFVVTVNGKIT
jgi:hypothetical protein